MTNHVLIFTFLVVFIALGIFMPFVSDLVGESSANDRLDSVSDLTIVDVILNIGKAATWTFGTLPFWLDAVLVVFRLIFYIMLAHIIRGG